MIKNLPMSVKQGNKMDDNYKIFKVRVLYNVKTDHSDEVVKFESRIVVHPAFARYSSFFF